MPTRMHDEIKRLARFHGGPCLSIVLPTHLRPPAAAPAARLRQLLADGAQQLLDAGATPAVVSAMLAPAQDLAADRAFWRHPQPALALFAAPGALHTYWLPYEVAALMIAGAHFHLKPLFALLPYDAPFYVLALSKNHVRLLRGTWDTVEPLELPGAPASLADTLAYDDFAPQRQYHPGGPTGTAVFYGHGAAVDTAKDELRRYCQQLDRAVCDVLGGARAPLVLAGVSYLLAIYRAVSAYPAILDDAVVGSPDHRSDEELRAEAWPLVAAARGGRQAAAVERYHALAATSPSRTTRHLRTIIAAAASGQIETLFVAGDRQQWGRYDEANGAVALHDVAAIGDDDLLDTAAVQTFVHGGEVWVMPGEQVPGGELCAAVLRRAGE